MVHGQGSAQAVSEADTPNVKGGLTKKQEAFAFAFVETRNATEAYRRSYDVEPNARDPWISVEACLLLDNPKVARRIKELQEQAARLALFTIKQAFDEYEDARQLAHSTGAAGAAVSAVNAKVKLFGLDRPERLEVTGKDGDPIKTEHVGAFGKLIAAIADRKAEE